MPSISTLFGLIEKLESSEITVHWERCVLSRNRNASCSRCAEACASGCLAFEKNKFSVESGKCTGCGACAAACPTCAIETKRQSDQELYQQCKSSMAASGGEAVIACGRMLSDAKGLYDSGKVAGVACLGRVDESLIAMLSAIGAERITLVHAKCAECECASGGRSSQAICDAANALLGVWGSSARARVSGKLPSFTRRADAAEFDEGRRKFFSDMKEGMRDAALASADYAVKDALGAQERTPKPKIAKVMDDGTLPHFIPGRRKRLLASLRLMGKPQDAALATRLFGRMSLDGARCVSCRMCATFCPTGAISKLDDEDGSFGIEHRSDICVQCRLCEDICPGGALAVLDTVPAADIAEGASIRFEMPPMKNPPGTPHAILGSLKDLLGCDQVYER